MKIATPRIRPAGLQNRSIGAAPGTARRVDRDEVRALLVRLDGLAGDARHEAIFTAAIESGGIFHGPVAGNAVLHLHRIPVAAATEDAAIDAWIARARQVVADT